MALITFCKDINFPVSVDIFPVPNLEYTVYLSTFRNNKMTHMESSLTIQAIKEALVKSCLELKPSLFKPFLASKKVTVDCVDKEVFYKSFKYMLRVTKKISEGELSLNIKTADAHNQLVQEYCFYDAVHLHPRLIIIVREDVDTLHLEVMPF